MKTGSKWKALLVALVSCLLLTLFFSPSLPVDETLQGVVLSTSRQNEVAPVSIHLKGESRFSLIGRDELYLEMETTGFHGPNLYLNLADLSGGIDAGTATDEVYQLRGEARATPFGKRIEIVAFYSSNREGAHAPQQCLVFPATDRDSALTLIQKYAPEFYESFADSAS